MHPGGIVWSAVAACALERESSVAEAIGAGALGYELAVRLAEAAGSEHRRRWHVTATAGTVGAAGAAARLLGGDDSVPDAVAHAVSVAGGAVHAVFERTSTRLLHRAHATMSGIACARVACAGKPAGRRILDEGRGTFVLEDAERLTGSRASSALAETGFRLHPFTGFAHSAIDAARTLGPLGAIERVRVSVSPIAATLASNPSPVGPDEEWWSIQAAVAHVLGTDIARVDVEPSEAGWAATIEVTLRDGSSRMASVTEPLGHPDRPASDADLHAKWMRLNGDGGAELFEMLASARGSDSFRSTVSSVV